ncbi:MAG: PQQ-binding-like beta-propeller repeat protein [Candidatus Omnitrophica bacterium]|nr:PQQ-binding-like beta-propeller repeat protein [Candidatus Omnitrophota bacterium]
MDIQQLTWKMVERPLLPVENSWVDAAPFAALFILCGLTILAIFKLRRQHQPLRHLIQLAALLIFAFTFHRCFCAMRGWVFGLSEIGKDNLSLFQNTCIFIPILAFVFAFGRIFCGWICPLGFIQEGLGKINIKSKKIKIVLLCGFLAIIFFLLWRLRPVNYFVIQNAASLLGLSLLIICLTAVINPQSDTALKKIKYFYLTLWTILIIFGVFVTDPWCSIYGNEIDYSSLIGFLAVIFSGLIVSMAWCRYICPLGALFALFSKFYAYRIKDSGRADARKQDICPMHAINEKGAVDNQNCIFCLRCKGTIQKNIPLIILAILLSASPLMAADWQTFGADAQHTGTSEVNFSSQELTTSWNFSPTQHVWNYEKTSYEKGKSVWSSSIATLDVEGKKIIFTGFYDHNLYAINAQDGKNLWRYTTGGSLSAAPAAKTINGTPMVFIGSGDRTVYALDAKTGKKIWSYETEKWDYTTSEGIPSSGIIENISGKELFFICFWNNNYRLFGNIQKGEIFSFNAADGRLFWRKKLANVPLNSPALALINNKPVLLVTAHNGCLWCLDAINGQTIWYFISDASIHSSASIIKVKDKEYVVFFFFFLRAVN